MALLLAEGPGWIAVDSKSVTLISNRPEAETRQILWRLEQLKDLLPERGPGSSVEILLFASVEQFRAFQPSESSAGYFRNQPGRPALVAATPEAALHEFVHFALQDAGLPLWASEGLADYYATARLEAPEIVLGLPHAARLAELRPGAWIPLAELARVDHQASYYRDPQGRRAFYAQSWALVQFLKLTGRSLRADLPGLEAELAAHLARGASLPPERLPLRVVDSTGFRVRPISEPEAVFRLANLRHDPAPALEELVANWPEFTAAWEQLAVLALAAHRLDRAQECLERAVELNTRNAETYYLAGLVQLHHRRDQGMATPLLARAAQLDPGNKLYRLALDGIRQQEEEAALRETRLLAMSVSAPIPTRSWESPAVVAPTPTRPRLSQPKKQPWLFGPVRLISCERRTCFYTR
jgi:tetratricopeptide (TPR) repeat protein